MSYIPPSFITIGDPYDKKKVIDERSYGKSFVAVAPKKGNGPDALFDKQFKSIHEGDKYIDPGAADKKYKLEKAKKNLVPEGFKFANPPPKGCGLGSYYGCVGKYNPWPHETDYIVPRKGEAPPKPKHEGRNIYCAPLKKGGYGFPGTLLSDYGTNYVANFYDAGREEERKRLQAHNAILAQRGQPFRPAGRAEKTFDVPPDSKTGVSGCYRLTKPLAPRRQVKAEVKKKIDTPWRPGGTVLPTLLAKVEYREDPYDGYDPREGTKKKKFSDKASWRPGGCTNHTGFTTSIAFKKL